MNPFSQILTDFKDVFLVLLGVTLSALLGNFAEDHKIVLKKRADDQELFHEALEILDEIVINARGPSVQIPIEKARRLEHLAYRVQSNLNLAVKLYEFGCDYNTQTTGSVILLLREILNSVNQPLRRAQERRARERRNS